ncbi:class I SAM-dependent methyltransferase [Actinocorallia sp. API 0066]|uniref:class I SAM-dependent methyltransferase n=1 Tax=Actinocorallia sp. API 0066 TaxID=2896846 RepID=UPI001E6258E4|nr:methyltransferase domain-containing protein [Actinocorallia sp. API 0066]MCD0449282.1 class I SAM-dependent methyltransferase [Actinocorallia sp. API 0066]
MKRRGAPDRIAAARAAVALVARHGDLAGRAVLEMSDDTGQHAAEFRRLGAACLVVTPGRAGHTAPAARDTVLAEPYWLPVGDRRVDVCFLADTLEHTPDPAGLLDEMIRVTRPGGLVCLSYPVRPERRDTVTRLVRSRRDVTPVELRPRRWDLLLAVRGLRAAPAGNPLVVLRRAR